MSGTIRIKRAIIAFFNKWLTTMNWSVLPSNSWDTKCKFSFGFRYPAKTIKIVEPSYQHALSDPFLKGSGVTQALFCDPQLRNRGDIFTAHRFRIGEQGKIPGDRKDSFVMMIFIVYKLRKKATRLIVWKTPLLIPQKIFACIIL